MHLNTFQKLIKHMVTFNNNNYSNESSLILENELVTFIEFDTVEIIVIFNFIIIKGNNLLFTKW